MQRLPTPPDARHMTVRAKPLAEGERISRAFRDVILLALLAWKPFYGRELAEEYEWVTGEVLTSLSIYSNLKRLREAGYIRRVDRPRIHGSAKAYRPTRAGHHVLQMTRRLFTHGVLAAEHAA